MSIDQLIALCASIGAFMSAIAAFLAVRQNTKQREASYSPELTMARTEFMASKNPLLTGPFAKLWVHKKDQANFKEEDVLSRFALRIHNIGLGAAKEVKLAWSFPIDALVSIINDKAQKLLIPAYFKYESETLSLKSEKLGQMTASWRGEKQATVDYVLPASVAPEGVGIHVPYVYVELVSALIYFSAKENASLKEDGSFFDIPALELELEYFDIGGDKHKSSFVIELKLYMIHGDGDGFYACMQSRRGA